MKTISFLTSLFLFVGCVGTDQLTLDDLGLYGPKLVVNTVLTEDQEIELQLTHSTASTSSDFPGPVKDATVTLTRNGQNEVLSFDPFDSVYRSTTKPQPGDQFLLDVRADGYLFVNSSAKMPSSIASTAEIVDKGGRDTSGILSDLVKVEFTDEAGVKNYYKINFYYYNTTLGQFIQMAFNISDPDLAEYRDTRLDDGSMLFTDEQFDGEFKSIGTVAIYGLVLGNPAEKYKIEIESLSEDLFRYYRTLQNAQDAQNNGFINQLNNAVVIHSNVNNGLGIFGATSRVDHILQ